MAGIDNAALEIGTDEAITSGENKRGIDDQVSDVSQDPTADDADEELHNSRNPCIFFGNLLEKFWSSIASWIANNTQLAWNLAYIILALAYNTYFVASIYYMVSNGIEMDWCDGVGFLIILTSIAYLGLFYFQVVKKLWGKRIYKAVLKPCFDWLGGIWKYRYVHLTLVRFPYYAILMPFNAKQLPMEGIFPLIKNLSLSH